MKLHADKVKTGLTQPKRVGHRANKAGATALQDNRPQAAIQKKQLAAMQQAAPPAQKVRRPQAANKTGLPDNLKAGIENLSGVAMNDVKVHYNSPQPAQLQAHAYAQGTDIHIAPGQEKHLPHEAWHVVQQKQGRVRPTVQLRGKVNVNDDKGLEKEADIMGRKALQKVSHPASVPAAVTTGSTVQRQAVVQLLGAAVTIIKNEVVSASIGGSAPPTNLRGKRGDHTTPYTMFEAMAVNNVIGQTPAQAIKNLKIAVKRMKNLPGYQNAGPVTRKPLDQYYDQCIDFAENQVSNPPTKAEVEEMMERVVILRNAIPMTAYKNKNSTGGQGEASSVGGLDWAEFKVQRGTWTSKGDFSGNPMQNVWKTFDWGAAANHNLSAVEWGDLLTQHILTVRDAFPYIFEIKGIYTMQDMKTYVVKNLLSAKLPYGISAVTVAKNIKV